jgi:hypothetical protein
MRPDRQMAGLSLGERSACPTALRLSRGRRRLRSITLVPRTLEPLVAAALDAVPIASLPNLRVTSDAETLEHAVRRGLENADFEKWLADWLATDILHLARMFGELTRAQRFLVRLETITDDACRKFHVDNVGFRLVTTYRGPGTQWIEPSALATPPMCEAPPPDAIQQLERGWIAVMRGGKTTTLERPGLLHRSPPITGTGVGRLFLAIDDTADHIH